MKASPGRPSVGVGDADLRWADPDQRDGGAAKRPWLQPHGAAGSLRHRDEGGETASVLQGNLHDWLYLLHLPIRVGESIHCPTAKVLRVIHRSTNFPYNGQGPKTPVEASCCESIASLHAVARRYRRATKVGVCAPQAAQLVLRVPALRPAEWPVPGVLGQQWLSESVRIRRHREGHRLRLRRLVSPARVRHALTPPEPG